MIGRCVVLVLDNAAVSSLSPLAMVGERTVGVTQELPGAVMVLLLSLNCSAALDR